MAEARKPKAPPAVRLEDLRPLLVGPEQHRIQRIEERLDHHLGEAVAGVLPEAVADSSRRGEALGWALDPVVDGCIRRSISKDPRCFADALAPALGPGIRKAVSQAIRATFERFNQALDRSLSLESVRWRLEARRTGRPFAEVVLLRTLVYRVEQVFLIHRATGLLLEHVTADERGSADPDQVSAMMSALEQFTHEAFREDARLERFRVGTLAGWVEHGPAAILVAIVRGIAPEGYESVLREALDRAHLSFGPALTEFHGDTAPFAGARETLSECLKEQRRAPPRRGRRWLLVAGLAATAIALTAWMMSAERRSLARQRSFAAYADALGREPGLVVIAKEQRRGRAFFSGLRDPLAADPTAVLARRGLDPAGAVTRFDPYYSLDPRIVELRVRETLRPPPGVSLRFHDGVVEARGLAPRGWIVRARGAAPLLPGVTAFDDRRVHDEEALQVAERAARALEGLSVYFPVGSDRPSAGQGEVVERIAREAEALHRAARAAGVRVRIEVLGYVDPSGSPEDNARIAEGRAGALARELTAHGVPADEVHPRGVGVPAAEPRPGSWERARSATCRAELSGAAEE